MNGAGVAVGGTRVSAPWWLYVLLAYGYEPIINASSTHGELFEVYCTFFAYILVDYYRREYPVRGDMPWTVRVIRNYWNRPLGEYG